MDTEIFSEVSRKVMDDRTGLEVYRVIFCEPGFYRMIGGETNLLVECPENAYLFGNPGEPVLAMTERIREWTITVIHDLRRRRTTWTANQWNASAAWWRELRTSRKGTAC